MTYAIENRSDFYLVEVARTRAEESDKDILNLREEIIGFLVGYFEEKAKKLFNRLTGRQFEIERSKEFWTPLTNSELIDELKVLYTEYNVKHASQYIHSLYDLLDIDRTIREFADAAANSRITTIYLNQKQYNIIFK